MSVQMEVEGVYNNIAIIVNEGGVIESVNVKVSL